MSRFNLTGHDRYRISKAREELAALDGLDLGDERAMARTIGRLEVALQQLVEMVDQAERDERPGGLPTFGPTELQNVHDDTGPAVAIVRVDFALSREELQTALAYGYAESNSMRPIGELSVEEVRAEVEGYVAITGYMQMIRHVESERVRRPQGDPVTNAAFDAALDRAYPAPTDPNGSVAMQAPRYGDGTVTLQTLDHGEITVAEPVWCLGHDGETVGHRADITHNGRHVTASAETENGTVDILDAHISHAPYAQLQPEPHPVVSVHVDIEEDLTVEDGRQVAHGLHVAGLRLARLVADAGRLQRGDR